jgi:PAS domain S-box-containing protein
MAGNAPKQQKSMMKKIPQNIADIVLRALEFTTDGILIGGLDGTVYYHNKAWLRIHALDENLDLRGKKFRDYERPELHPMLNTLTKNLLKRGSYTYQLGTVRRDGVYHDVHIAANIIREFDPHVVVVVLREVTDLVQVRSEVARRNVELALLNEIHGIIAKARSQKRVMRQMMELLGDFVGAKYQSIYLADHSKDYVVLIESAGLSERVRRLAAVVPLKNSVLRKIIRSRRSFVIEEDTSNYAEHPQDFRALLGVRRTIGFVFRTGTNRDYVALFGMAEAKTIDPDVRSFFDSAARQFGIAMERVELLDALGKREKELRELTVRLIDSGEEEKRRCSRMLHDEVGQALTALRFELETLEKSLKPQGPCVRKSLEAIRGQIRFVSEGTRSLSKSLHPAMLDELGLVPTLNWYIDSFVRTEGLEVEFDQAGFDEDLPIRVSLALYRVAQESLTNIVRHAEASRVTISLTKGYPYAIMEIEDNGQGISAAKGKSKSKGLGLVSMRERVEHMGGVFHLRSSPGRGTRIRVEIPIEVRDA